MAAKQFYLPFPTAFSSNGLPVAGAQLRFRLTGTTTAAAVYSDSGLTTELTNPVVANAAGRFPTVYLDETVTYRLDILDAQGVVLDSVDPYIPGATNAEITIGIGNIQTVSSHTALRALTPSNGDQVWLVQSGIPPRLFTFSTSNLSANITRDPTGIANVAPDSDATGASGAWKLNYDGTIFAEWSDEYSSASDATDAVHAAYDYLMNTSSEAVAWELYQVLTTRGFGDQNYKAEYADEASLPSVGSLSEYDVVRAISEDTLWRVKGGVYVQIENRALNGERIFSKTQGKKAGFQLKAGMPDWMKLMGISCTEGIIENLKFDGRHASTQWSGYASIQDNPDTLIGVYVEGYAIHWANNDVRFFPNVAFESKGIVGVLHITGGANSFKYSGTGLKLDRHSSVKADKLWVEGNSVCDVLLKHDMLAAASDINTSITNWRRSAIEIESIYSENASNSAPIFQIEGGHVGWKIGMVAKHGTGTNRKTIYCKNSADSDNIWVGSVGGRAELGAGFNHIIDIESAHRNITVVRQGAPWSQVQNTTNWVFNDAGKDNQCVWGAPAPTAFRPGVLASSVAIGDSTNFVDEVASGGGTVAIVTGGIYGPVADSHADNTAGSGGPCFARMSSMEPILGGGTEATCYARNNAAISATATFYCQLALKAEAHQRVSLALFDATNNQWYNWESATWTASGSADAFGLYRTIYADRHNIFHQVSFTNDGTTRSIRPQVRVRGSGTCDLYHAAVVDIPNARLIAAKDGALVTPVEKPVCAFATLPAATTVPNGTQAIVTDCNTTTLGATAAGGGANRVPVNSDGTNWKVG